MGKVFVVPGSASENLARKITQEVGVEVLGVERKVFPDGETYLRICAEDLSGASVYVVQSLARKPNDYLLELLLLVEAAKGLGAKKVTAVIPYLAYARQDSRFKPGEPISIVAIARALEAVGVDEVVTVDMHLHRFHDVSEVFRVPATNLTSIPLLAKFVKEVWKLEKPVIIGPDEESEQWASIMGRELGTTYSVLEKERLSATEVQIKVRGEVSVKDRDVVIVDDIVSTGGTVAEAAKVLKQLGARRVFAAVVHLVLAPGAIERMKSAGVVDIVGTDTIESPYSHVSVAPVIAKYIKEREGL
ncbi:MAG: ribose-phosphate diphosphokinase [Thermoprotei archaeon]|nr:MAG: ribose-phosphate diphosphokinase [Thermoprotei archaeon]RLE56782.1 MAG: ribose-phosphate diphosphokinase [Thermoprotei archaeon]